MTTLHHSVSILLGRTESKLNALARLRVVKCISKASVVSDHLHRIVEWLLLQCINSCVNLVVLLDTCKLFADGAIGLLVAGEARVERREESWHKLSLARNDVTHLRVLQMPAHGNHVGETCTEPALAQRKPRPSYLDRLSTIRLKKMNSPHKKKPTEIVYTV